MQHVLFVHGTGVRCAEYAATMAVLSEQIGLKGCHLHGCLWGDDYGAQLGQSLSVPLYAQSKALDRGDNDPLEEWARLLLDPFVEIRLVANTSPAETNPFANAQVELAAIARLPVVTARLEADSVVLHLETDEAGITISGASLTALAESAAELRDLSETTDALTRVCNAVGGGTEGNEFAAELAARAIVAGWLLRGEINGLVQPGGDARDSVVGWLARELGASTSQHKAILGSARAAALWPLRNIAGTVGMFALRATAWGTARYRKSLADASSLRIGDILLYQARGEHIRARILDAIRDIGRPVTVIAHSLGGIAAVDLLVKSPHSSVRGLITVGSQAPFLYEIGALTSLERGMTLPSTFPPWLNIFDRNDLLSFMAEPVFPSSDVHDQEVISGQPFPIAHSAYWTQRDFWQAFVTFSNRLQP